MCVCVQRRKGERKGRESSREPDAMVHLGRGVSSEVSGQGGLGHDTVLVFTTSM